MKRTEKSGARLRRHVLDFDCREATFEARLLRILDRGTPLLVLLHLLMQYTSRTYPHFPI